MSTAGAVLNDLVWIPDLKDGFALAEVTDMSDKGVTVTRLSDKGTATVSLDKALPAHRKQDLEGVSYNDNTQLMYLHAASLLNNLRLRHAKDEIYTFTGHILVAVNPFKALNIYEGKYLMQYRGRSIGTEPPHVYAIADYAYRNMKSAKLSQSIIVSGESGAGKTETSKYIMKYLTALGHNDVAVTNINKLEQMVLETNPVLESFGNAKTTRNKNSSRFGKFIEIHFDANAILDGASISHYLLEKSRVVLQNPNERNYHVFYELARGAPEKWQKAFSLQAPEKFKILATTTSVDGVDDKAMFGVLSKAMDNIGMTENEKEDVFRTVASVLHIGNLEFTDDGSTKGGSKVSNADVLKIAAGLLGVKEDKMQLALTERLMSQAGKHQTIIRKPLKSDEAALSSMALAKSVYKSLFDYIVSRVNKALPFKGVPGGKTTSVVLSATQGTIENEDSFYIGVLDIAGFEYFDHNSYEQFCINFCNEKLQGFFNEKVLKQEQEIYEKEGIFVPPIRYLSNDDCIEMIEDAKNGIFAVLDESAKGPSASDKAFGTAAHEKHMKHPKFADPKKSPLKAHQKLNRDEAFVIRHYAGAVCYEVVGFLEKNNDALSIDLEELLRSSSSAFVSGLCDLSPEDNAQKGKLNFVSVGAKFKKQLKELLFKLNNTKSHFIRCVKPNMGQLAAKFDGIDVMQQLHCGGMMEVLELMQKGYPSRTDFQTLYNMYKAFLPPLLQNLDARTFCEALIFALGSNEDDFKFGLTKVFFRAGKYALLDQITRNDDSMTKEIVEKVRRWLLRKRWRKAIFATVASIKLSKKIRVRLNARIVATTMARAFLARDKYVVVFQQFRDARIALELAEARRRAQEEAERAAREAAERERQRLEELRRLDEERRQKEEDEERSLKEMAESERQRVIGEKRRLEEEEKRMQDEEKRQKDAQDAYEKLKSSDAGKAQEEELRRKEQEQRDHDLAVRLTRELNEDAPPTPEPVRIEIVPVVAPAVTASSSVDLSKWSYAQLRDTINSSTDIEMLQACRNEFQKRLKAYYNWKQKYEGKSPANPAASATTGPSGATSMANILQQPTMTAVAPIVRAPEAARKVVPLDRYFRIPFTRPGAKGKAKKKGLWWAHFEGQRVKRQLEVHPNSKPVLLIAGQNDSEMCDLSLAETGLTEKPGAEISKATFEEEWTRCLAMLGKSERAKKIINILEDCGF